MEQKEINSNTLREWLNEGKKFNILDIRPRQEREEWYIPGSMHVDAYDKLKKNNPEALKTIEVDKSLPIVTVCAAGNTSMIAAGLLNKAGYKAYSLRGGMKDWSLSWNTASISFDDFEIIQFRRTGKGCLSYMIVSGEEVLVLDASLPVEVIKEYIDQRKLTLKYAVDTHIHADHLSRSKELAETYDITPSMPSNDRLDYSFNAIEDDHIFSLGKIHVRAIHTPGHTLESTCYLVDNKILLTGDTLFIDGVGRPDLKASKEEVEQRAILLYHSLRKLLALDKSILVMPGHTNQPIPFDQKIIQSSLGEISSKISLLNQGKDQFVQSLIKRIPATPGNYLTIVEKNISGDFTGINPVDLEAGANRCAVS